MAARKSAVQKKADTQARRLEVVSESVAAAPALDRIIHERLRLGMVSALSIHDALSFGELKSILGTTDGNLSVHARKLEDAGYVECRKGYDGRVPKTDYRLTPVGRRALERYLAHMEALIHAMKTK
ncbi:MAG: winged helix-turn-helix domain-containing protein [Thermoanaerobaculia bacterium]